VSPAGRSAPDEGASPAPSRPEGGSGRTLRTLAAFVVVVAGLKLASSFLVPIAVAGFVTVVSLPFKARLRRWGLPSGVAVAVTVVCAVATLVVFTFVLAASLESFGEELPPLREKIDARTADAAERLENLGWASGAAGLKDHLNPRGLVDLVQWTTQSLLDVLSSLVVILLLTVFALIEAEGVPRKMRAALANPDADLGMYTAMASAVGTYAFWKTVMNAATGVLVTLTCWAFDVREPLLWGLMAFLFNYIPNIGSLIVAVPITVLAWIDHGAGRALMVLLVYLAVNQTIGVVVEPRLMGRKMGLSPLVVLLSLLFWGWIWGPVGMLLSVPLTMIVRTLLLKTDDGRALGVLLGPASEAPPRVAAP
jgi:AI-2 transport protein TqsA